MKVDPVLSKSANWYLKLLRQKQPWLWSVSKNTVMNCILEAFRKSGHAVRSKDCYGDIYWKAAPALMREVEAEVSETWKKITKRPVMQI